MTDTAWIDDLAASYFADEERMTTLRAIDLRMIAGAVCARCGSGRRTVVVISARSPAEIDLAERERTRREVCSSCWEKLVHQLGAVGARNAWEKAAWNEDAAPDRVILRGEIQVNARPGKAEDVLAAVVDRHRRYERLFRERPRGWTRKRWRFALMAWRAYLDPRVGTYAAVAQHGAELAKPLGLWSEDTVRGAIGAARAVVAQRARRTGKLRVAA